MVTGFIEHGVSESPLPSRGERQIALERLAPAYKDGTILYCPRYKEEYKIYFSHYDIQHGRKLYMLESLVTGDLYFDRSEQYLDTCVRVYGVHPCS